MRRRASIVLALCVVMIVSVVGVSADRSGVSWPGGTKPDAQYYADSGFIYITWPAATGAVTAYTACALIKTIRNCADLGADARSLYVVPQVAGTWTIAVTAYDADGDLATIKTRLSVP